MSSEAYPHYGRAADQGAPYDETGSGGSYGTGSGGSYGTGSGGSYGTGQGGSYGDDGSGAELILAPVRRRAGARLIDAGLLGVVGFALILPFIIAAAGLDRPGASVKDTGAVWSGVSIFGWILVLGVLPFAYEAVQLALWGQTLGKRVFGLRVLDETGAPLTPGRAAGRAAVNNLAYLFGCGVGTVMAYLWAVWDRPLHQALHDRLAATVVVDDREYGDE